VLCKSTNQPANHAPRQQHPNCQKSARCPCPDEGHWVRFGARLRPNVSYHWHRLQLNAENVLWDNGCNFRLSKRSMLSIENTIFDPVPRPDMVFKRQKIPTTGHSTQRQPDNQPSNQSNQLAQATHNHSFVITHPACHLPPHHSHAGVPNDHNLLQQTNLRLYWCRGSVTFVRLGRVSERGRIRAC
jgi:hypothetical protein